MTFAFYDNERRLLQRCLDGDQTAWREFFEQYNQTILHVARWSKWGFDPDEIDDVAQDIAEEVVKSLSLFSFRSSVRTFVYRIAANTCVGRLRKKAALKRISDTDRRSLDTVGGDDDETAHVPGSSDPNQEEILGDAERLLLLKSRLASLSENCKRLIRLRYWNDLSFREMAHIMNAKENTLIVQFKRCLTKLAKAVQQEGHDECMQEL